MDARERGATILHAHPLLEARAQGDRWSATLVHADGGRARGSSARARRERHGPVGGPHSSTARRPSPARRHPRIVKGSHIVVPKLFEHDYAYIFQAPDRRIVFAIPYEGEFTLIGTTERDYQGDLATPVIETAEESTTCSRWRTGISRATLTRADVRWTFAGLRPLLATIARDVATSVTRDYVLDLEHEGPPLLSVYGGKLTTYRRLAEDVLDDLAPRLGWRAAALDGDARRCRAATCRRGLRRVPARPARGICRGCPTRCARVSRAPTERGRGACSAARDRSPISARRCFRACTSARSTICVREEWAVTAEDILYRRSKLALHLPPTRQRASTTGSTRSRDGLHGRWCRL